MTRKALTIRAKGVRIYIDKTYPCDVNAAVSFDHRMVKYERSL